MYKVLNLRKVVKYLFIIYILTLIYLLFLKEGYRIKENFKFLSNEHFAYCLNLRPLSTVKKYIRAYSNNNVTLKVLLENILGNFILFIPMSFFAVFKMKKFNVIKYMCTLFCIIILVEFLQFYCMVGVADIDDVILNFLGGILSMTFFIIIKK